MRGLGRFADESAEEICGKTHEVVMKILEIEDSYPLSPMQHGMLFESLYSPRSGVNIVQIICSMPERVDTPFFKDAWCRIIRHHPVLRTSFHFEDVEEPVQRVHKQVQPSFYEHEWTGLSGSEADRRLEEFLREDRLRGFDLTTAPLMRFSLIRISGDDSRFICTFHHALLDGRSFMGLLREAFSLYDALREGTDVRLESRRPYRDYIEWQRGLDFSEGIEFWKRQLRDFSAAKPLNMSRSSSGGNRGYGNQETYLPASLTADMKSFAQRHGLTLNTLIQGAWALLLSRYTGEKDVVFGATRACRHLPLEGLGAMVGLFINTVPVRAGTASGTRVLPWLKGLRSQWVEMRRHEHVPLIKIKSCAEVPADQPLFESLLVFENQSPDAFMRAQCGLWGLRKCIKREQTGFPVSIGIFSGEEIWIKIQYDRDRFDEDAASRIPGHIRTLLENMVMYPEKTLSEMPLLSAEEMHAMLIEWNGKKVEFPEGKCIHHLFEEWACRTTEETAVVFEGQSLKYGELNRASNRLADYLIRQGVSSNELVGVCLDRSLEMVIAVLAVLKAGAAYLPLDPAYPRERLSFMLKDAQARLVLSIRRFAGMLTGSEYRTILLDQDIDRTSSENDPALPVRSAPENLAYVMYTSGSTGRPKGIMISHRNVVGFLYSYKHVTLDGEKRIGTMVAPFSFDTSVEEIFSTLCFGGTLHIIRPEHSVDAGYFASYLVEHNITTAYIVPDVLHDIADRLRGMKERLSLKCLITGLAPKKQSVLQHVRNISGELRILNAYGPTEVTYGATAYEFLSAGEPERDVPIGRPFPNYEVYIADADLQPVPVGVPGEILIGGVGLSRGYLNRPELTAAKFIPHPFDKRPEARLYRTGDLGRYLHDGNIEFLGRIDDQVKIRGYRVEPAEIEASLLLHPDVRQAAVAVREIRPGDKRLIAYVVLKDGWMLAAKELRGFLKEKLPGYMIPSAFEVLDALPLMPNGKIDRQALPAPDLCCIIDDAGYARPHTCVEEILAGIWSEVLGADMVGIHDNFFESGGHSLLATQVVSRIRNLFNVEIPLRTLFERPTVSELAEVLGAVSHTGEMQSDPPVLPISRQGPLPLSFAQERMWFLDTFSGGSPVYNILFTIRLGGHLKITALEQGLKEIIRRHEVLRTKFPVENDMPVQRITPEVIFRLPIDDISAMPGKTLEAGALQMAKEDASRAFDLAGGPLFRARLIRLKPDYHMLALTMHHIVFDGWSTGILFRELSVLYQAFSNGEPSPLPDPHLQYADFAGWQRQWFQGKTLAGQLSYWMKQLEGAPAFTGLTTDRPRPPVQTYRGSWQTLSLSEELTRRLKSLCRSEGVTLFMTLLAGFNAMLHRYTGQEDLVIGSPIAGRTKVETEGIIGFFVNTLVLRTNLSGEPSFQELLRRVKKTTLEAYAHQDLPFEKLVEKLQPERNPGHTPLFQVMFAHQNTPAAVLKLNDLTLSGMDIDLGISKFDLTVYVTEAPELLSLTFEYNTDLFSDNTVRNLVAHYLGLLELMADDPRRSITELSEAERRILLVEWNDTKRDYPHDICLQRLFEEQVQKMPDAPAVEFEDTSLSYRELNNRANKLALHLIALGMSPGDHIAIFAERSSALIAGILGIIKAGCVYVPIDPDCPAGRLTFILEDAHVSAIVTKTKLIRDIRSDGVQSVCLDALWDDIDRSSIDAPALTRSPHDPAYIIYTSGSTGMPKGVTIPHRAIVRLVRNTDYIKMMPSNRIAQVSNPSFDAATFEIWGALLNGACLVGISRDEALSGVEMERALKEKCITMMFLTTALFNMIARSNPAAFKNLHTLLFGGEAADTESVRMVLKQGPPLHLLHVYGPTENTTFSTWHEISSLPETAVTVPIGRPIANTSAYVLNRYLRPVPVGAAAELYLGGDGLAVGYFNQPLLTAESFVRNPFSSDPGDRLYKTGDVVRYLPDGNLEFLGRKDNQVKIRGFRVELREIEIALMDHKRIREAVVTCRKDTSGNNRLVACIVCDNNFEINENDLRSFLQNKIPDYMVPSSFHVIDRIPLTPNGKIDYRALPERVLRTCSPRRPFSGPEQKLHKELIRMWEEVLDRRPVGITDNFFDLGGHSLMITRLFSIIEKEYGFRIPPSVLFQSPTVEQLAVEISGLSGSASVSCLVPFRKEGQGPPLICIPHVTGSSLVFRYLIQYIDSDHPVYGLDTFEDILHGSLEEAAAKIAKEIIRATPHGSLFLIGYSSGGALALEIARQLRANGREVPFLAMLDTFSPGLSGRGTYRTKKGLIMAFARNFPFWLYHYVPFWISHYFGVVRIKAGKLFRVKRWATRGHVGRLPGEMKDVIVWLKQLSLEKYPGRIIYYKARVEALFHGDASKGWEGIADSVEVQTVPGTHLELLKEPHVRTLADKINAELRNLR